MKVFNVLFITSSRIGDAVLSTGLLNHIEQKYPNAKVTIVCGPLAVELFQGYPERHRIIPLKKRKFKMHWFRLWKEVRGEDWDLIVDLRNSLMSRVLRAEQKFIFGDHIDQTKHKVEQMAQVMGLEDVPAPKLWVSEDQKIRAANLMGDHAKPIIGVGPAANWAGKTWPVDRFVSVLKWMTGPGGVMQGSPIAVFAAPGEEEIGERVMKLLQPKITIDLVAKADPGTVAGCLQRCGFYIGNDSGLMHMAAALGVKTLGLFGPSYPELYRPWGEDAHFIQTPKNYDELINYDGYDPKTAPCLMKGLEVQAVEEKIKEIFALD